MGVKGGEWAKGRKKLAIYDCPRIVSSALSERLSKAGYDILFEGPLRPDTARPDADVWVTKWTGCLREAFINQHHPKTGFVTLSVGTEHIDVDAAMKLGLEVRNCPNYSANSVAEHAIALALRSRYHRTGLPPLAAGTQIFTNFSDQLAEAAIAEILFRSRQMALGMERAKRLDYGHPLRPDEPWKNRELKGLDVLIVGQDASAARLAHTLSCGFGSRLYGFETDEALAAFNVEAMGSTLFLKHAQDMDYIFLLTDKHGMIDGERCFDSERMNSPQSKLSESKVAVLGTGRIGSRIARIAACGFNCNVTAYSQTEKPELATLGVRYAASVSAAIRDADFIFIALPLNAGTWSLISEKELSSLSMGKPRTIINVTRDGIIDNGALLARLDSSRRLVYATDVLPDDVMLWQGGKAAPLTKEFARRERVIATPHEGDCSAGSLLRMAAEVEGNLAEMPW